MKILVTGGAGFIGSTLVRHLVHRRNEVLTVDKLTYAGTLTSLATISDHAGHRFLRADVCDRSAVTQAFESFRPDAVMHLAAESHVDRSITSARDFLDTNVLGTFNMLECARAYWTSLSASGRAAFRFLHVSTDEVYGSLGAEGAFTEQTSYDPSSPYSATKAASDHLAKAWQRTYGLPVIVTNCSNNYGPYHFPEKLIPLTILNAIDGKPLPVYGNGENARDWLFVEDHVEALALIVARGRVGETYNVGGRSERRNIDVVKKICLRLDHLLPQEKSRETLITFVDDRPGHDFRYAIDPTKLEKELGWRPTTSFEDGINKTIRWYLENEWWWGPLRKTYDGHRLGKLVSSGT